MVLGANRMDEAYLLDYGVWADVNVAEHAKSLIELMDFWNVDISVNDSGYGRQNNQYTFAIKPGKCYALFYKPSAFKPTFEMVDKLNGIYLPKKDFQYNVHADHTSLYDNLLSAIDTKRLQIPMDEDDELIPGTSPLREMLDNVCLIRLMISDVKGISKKKWVVTPSHYSAAFAMALVGLDHLMDDGASDTSGNDEFWLPHGFT